MPLATTTRLTPVGKMMRNGYRTLIAFAADPDVSLWERAVKPPGLDGGAPIDTTTMWNTKYRSKTPRALITNDDVTGSCGWNPAVYPQLEALINVETSITIRFPNGGTLDFFGFLQKFEPGELSDDNFPLATYTVVCTNVDPVTGQETDPVYTPPVGGAPMEPLADWDFTSPRQEEESGADSENTEEAAWTEVPMAA